MIRSAFTPSWVSELELSEPLGPLVAPSRENGRPYARARVLVRLHGWPIGPVDVTLRDGTLPAADVLAVLRDRLDAAVAAHRHADGLDAVELTLDGMPAPASPRCGRPGPHADPAPFASVVVCTRDRAASLRPALESVLRQDYPRYEVLVVDNAPATTATREVVSELADPRVRYVLEPRPGLSCARNRAVREARGAIVAFTDDDVLADRFWLASIARGFTRAPRVACVAGLVPAAELESESQALFESKVSWGTRYEPAVYDLAAQRLDDALYPYSAGIFGTGANLAVSAAALRVAGPFDEALGAGSAPRGGEDLDYFVRVLRAGFAIAYEPAAIVWHVHRRDRDALRRQVYGYGCGLAAFVFKQLLSTGTAADVSRRIPRGLVRFARATAGDAGSPPLPLALRAMELWGVANGPLAYVRARLRLARERRGVYSSRRTAENSGCGDAGSSRVTS